MKKGNFNKAQILSNIDEKQGQTINLNVNFEKSQKKQMGNSTQSQSKSESIMDNYQFVKSLAQGKRVFKHKKTLKEYVSLQRTFPTSEMLIDYEQKMRKLLSVKHPYFLNETEHAMITSSTLCSMQFRVIHYFEHEPHTLQQQLQNRRVHQRSFDQKEIWSILCSAVLAMSYLTKQEILCFTLHPKNIVIDKMGMIKILSPLLADNGVQMIEQGFYYAPEHLKAFKTSNFSIVSNKSSVFTLGITLLHILSLEPMNELYDYQNCTVNMELLNQLVDKLTQTQIKNVLRKMLKFHTYQRITFTQLQQMLCNILQGGNEPQMSQSKRSNVTLTNEDISQKFSTSIHRAFGSNQNINQKPWSPVQTYSQPMYSKGYLVQNINQPKLIDIEDFPNQPSFQSNIDYQNVDQKDVQEKQQNHDKLQSSKLTQNNFSLLKDSTLYDNNNLGNTRNVLQQRSNTNISSSNNIPVQKQKQTFLKVQSKGQQNSFDTEVTSRPYHVREEFNIGVYQGYKLNNWRHGYGVFSYTEGGKYAGEWHKNKMQGRGALYYANDQIAYQGQWFNDKLHGYGILYNQIPTYTSNPFDFKSLHLLDNFWTKYEGNFYEDEKNGEGTLFLSNGQYYRGSFKEGLPHGNGVFKTINGELLKGNWILGMMQ